MSKELSAKTTLSHYRIVSKLGEGGMGEVWLAEDTRLGRQVALKLLPAEFTEDSERVRRFTLEAKAASALNHPNIIAVYDIGECETGRFIVMEFVAGRTLRAIIAKDNSLETLFTLGAQMAKALSTAHAAGITHRDIKPDNIMVRDDGYVKMLDFGLARLLPTTSSDPEAMTLAQQTTPGTVMGTLAYMSPEQASGQTVGSASDVFALGIVLYELATGSHPFKSETMIGYLHAITSQTPPAMTSIKSHLPVALDDLILRMLEKDARQRPTASEVAQALQEIEKYGSSNTLPIRVVAEKPKVSGAEEGFWVAVLPFKYRGNNAELEALAEGLSEDIITGLSRFSCLRVIARGSTLRFTSENADVRSIGKQLGARYVMEGSLRQAGSMLRLVIQLVDATTGAHLWAETYDRTVDADRIFALQDELVPRIVSTVADWYGVLTHSMSEAVRLKPFDQLTPYEAVLRSFGYYERVTAEEHAASRSALERAVEQAPGNADGWAMLSMMYGEEFRFGFNEQPDPMGRSLQAARRAVDAAPSNHFAYLALAQALFFRKEFDAFRHAAERAIALNPMDGSTMEYVSHLIAFSGDWDYGCEVAERARQLNPNHPGWYWAVPFYNAYRKGDYPTARVFALKIDQPTVDLCQVMLAAVYGQLGEHEAADRTVQTLLSLTPDTSVTRKQLDKWYQPELVEKLIDGLRKAGLNIDDQAEQAASSLSRPSSTESRSNDGFWVAVLPFKFTGSNAEVATLADGLTEEIVTGLSRFSYLRVISRSSTSRFATEASDIRTIGRTLGARYVMEGSLRLAGSLLRLSVQLVDSSTGAHLWAETYDRPLRAEDIFALQDDLVPRIVSTVADQYGALVHSMSESLRGKSADQYSAHEAAMRTFGYWERMTPEEHAEVRDILEAAVAAAPDHSDCLAELAMIYWHEYAFGFNLKPDPLGRARAAAQRAVASAPTSHFAHCALATGLFFQKDFQAFRTSADRALALNRMDASTMELLGQMIAYAGDWEYGLSVVERAMQLNPHHPGWYHYLAFCDAYRKRDYHGALASALKVNMPAYHWPHVYLAAAYGQLGEQQRASEALRQLDALIPNFGAIAREEMGKWLDAELTEHLLDGLRKAGLEIVDEESTSTSSSARLLSGESRADEGFWVAVLPFKFTGSNAEVATLAEGLSEEIITGLSRFSYLRVISRSSTLRYANETDDVRAVGKTLGARYVMEGSLRVAGSSLRISAQLVDAGTGAHLWAETYDRQFRADDVFTLQDDLVPRIVSTVADVNGVLPRSMCDVVCSKNPDELTPYEAVLRSFRYFDRVNAEELAAAQYCLEIAVKKAPTNADAWAMLALLFAQDYGQGFNLHSDALNSATMAAQRAVEVGPSNHLAHFSLAQARFFQKELQSFRNAAERAVALNPMDANSLAFMGELLTYVGDSERGLALATRAKQINPNHPGWFWYADFFHAYRQGDYRGALSLILKVNLPGHWGMHAGIAAANGQLGDLEAASKALRDLLKLRPDYGATVHNTLAKWFDPELCEQLIDGLRKAGLEIVEKPGVHQSSSESRVDEGFWIAVLPFKVVGTGTELESLALGMTEEIVTGFSRFSYLRVMSLGSTKKHPQSGDLRQIGAELGARYVMEGSIRQAGSTIRLAVRLVDTSNGAHLWAETFDRNFQPDQIFAMQDELIPRIVSTCADHFGVLARSISDAIRGKDSSQLSPYEALMRGFGYHYRLNPQEHAAARDILEQAVKDAPNNADCWAMLSWVYSHEYGHGFNPQPGSLDRALNAARRAVDLAPTNHLAYQTLAVALFFRKERTNCLSAAERALALNPLDASNEAIFLITFVDDWDRGCSLIKRAMDLNPYVPGWYRVILALNEYRKGNYREAVGETVKASAPGIWTDIVLSAAYAQLGEQAAARNALNNLIAENSADSVLNLLTKWFDAELVAHLTEGLCKAGLEIAADQSTPTSVAQLEPPSVTRGSFDAPAIAVLPFNNLSDDPEQEYFADGLAEDLITRLSLWRSFPVIARNSSFAYKGDSIDLKKVSSELGVRYVVQGSVRKSGNQVRISAQLIDSTTGRNVWAKTFDRELTDVFGVQDEISEAIATSLVGDLERAEHSRVQRRAPENLEAWGLYQRALPLIYNFTREDSAQARTLLARAVEHDPHFATALARLSEVGTWEVLYEWTDDSEQTLAAAIAEARRAVALDPLDAQARIALSFALMTAGDGHGALEESRQAVELNPSMPFALAIHAYHRHIAGHPPEESIGLVQHALRLSPHDPVEWLFYDVLSGAYLNAGRFDEGLEAGRRLIVLSPNYYWGYLWSAMNEVGLGRIEEARELVGQARGVKPELSFELARKCLGTMAPDVERHFLGALRQAGLEETDGETGRQGEAKTRGSFSSRDSFGSIIKTIAVLPFHNLSGEVEQEYFADGVTEEITNALSQIQGLRVAGRSSSFSFKGRNEDLRTVGAKLSVANILEGTLRRSGDRLRITAQLIDAASGYQIWSERYDRVMEDVFAVQDEIANTIAGRLQVSLSVSGEVQPAQPPTRHIGAYELYLKGRALLYQRGLSIPKAIDCFTQAVALDPQYAQAWAGLADGYTTSGYSGFSRPIEVMPRALEAAQRALQLDPDLAEAHNALANATLLYERKFDVAEREFKRALELNPNYPQVHAWYGLFFLHWIAGRVREGREELLKLHRVDPLSGYANVIIAFSSFSGDQLADAVDHARRGVELDPNSYLAQWCLSAALKCNGDYEEAEAAAERALALSGRHCWALATLTAIYAGWGKLENARAAFREMESRGTREYIQPSMLIEAAAAIGEIDQAIAFAQQALDDKDPLFVLLARTWPGYAPLRTDARFLKIVGELGLPGWKATA